MGTVQVCIFSFVILKESHSSILGVNIKESRVFIKLHLYRSHTLPLSFSKTFQELKGKHADSTFRESRVYNLMLFICADD